MGTGDSGNIQLQATVLPQNATDKTVAWHAEGITVSADGLVSWTDETPFGTHVVTATTVNGLTDTFELTLAGRNLIPIDSTDYITKVPSSIWDSHLSESTFPMDLEEGADVTFAVEVADYPSESVYIRPYIRFLYNEVRTSIISESTQAESSKIITKGNDGLVTVKTKVPAGAKYFLVAFKKSDGTTLIGYKWRHAKLEQGNVATQYTVAPEDL